MTAIYYGKFGLRATVFFSLIYIVQYQNIDNSINNRYVCITQKTLYCADLQL